MNFFLRSAFIVAAISTIPLTYRFAKGAKIYCIDLNYAEECANSFVLATGSLTATLFFLGGAIPNTTKKRILPKDE